VPSPGVDDGIVAGNGPTIITDGYNEIAIGCFVFLRNARFNPVTESTSNPRYWVARVTAGGGAAAAVVRVGRGASRVRGAAGVGCLADSYLLAVPHSHMSPPPPNLMPLGCSPP
jgi:hypothetical protein